MDVKVPDDTVYTIDKVVRDRLRKGRFGIDFSEYIGIENDEEHKMHFYHHEMLRLGKNSIQIPYIPISEQLQDRLAKSPILPQNRQKVNTSLYKSIREPKKGKRAKTVSKYGSVRKGHGTAKEQFSDWRMRKRASERMRNTLINQAKNEIRRGIFEDIIQFYQSLPHQEPLAEDQSDQKEEAKVEAAPKSPTFGDDEKIQEIHQKYKNFQDF